MSVLVDFQIRELCENAKMVDPFDPTLVNPASIDVRLGNEIEIEAFGTSELIRLDISEATRDEPFWLPPRGFCLAATLETFALPTTVCAQFVLKSSRAREGLDHLEAGWCDPGWGLGGDDKRSALTMELKNAREVAAIPLFPGLKIGQMKFTTTEQPPLMSYEVTGRYNGDKSVQSSKG